MNEAMIELRDLRKRYGDTEVLRGVDLSVRAGEVVALLGPNGAGKTTTVEILSTLRRPDAGTATVAGFDVVREAERVRERLGLTGQLAAVDDLLTGRENLRLMARLAHLPLAQVRSRADDLLALFDLTSAADRLVRTWSGGMRRRLDIAIGLVVRPAVVLLDEPTTGLDPRSRVEVWGVVRDVVAAGTTVLLTTQYLDEADTMADRVALLDDGRVVAAGTSAELKKRLGAAQVHLDLVGGGVERLVTDGTVADVRRVLSEVEDRGVAVASWRLAEPTLDDVFFELTGARRAERVEVAS
ncbi:MAG TPA: ATP-binding cassette domain-containing protein [Actinotalea sp.]|nr:ATP-binding cassette domain-containing protein [Actinotalea sp.]